MLKRASIKTAKQILKDDVSQTKKERKAKFNELSNDLNLRENVSTKSKPSNYSIPFLSQTDIECSSTESMETFFSDLKNEYKQIPKMSFFKKNKLGQTVEKFRDELKSFKAILNKIKVTRTTQRARNK